MNETSRSAPRIAVAASVLLWAALVLPSGNAGDLAHPEISDPADDVKCFANGNQIQCPGNDFLWNDVDIFHVWINDTAPDVLLTIQMKSGTSFQPGLSHPFGMGGSSANTPSASYDYTFNFVFAGVPLAAGAHMATDGKLTLLGIAKSALVHDANQLTVTVAKSRIGTVHAGDPISELFFTAHGKDAVNGAYTLDDRAPDANSPPPYNVQNEPPPPAAPPVHQYYEVPDVALHAAVSFDQATSGGYQYNWSKGPSEGSLNVSGQISAGNASLKVVDATGAVVYEGVVNGTVAVAQTFDAAKAGPWQIYLNLTGMTGGLSLDLSPDEAPSGSPAPEPTTTTPSSGPSNPTTGSATSSNETGGESGGSSPAAASKSPGVGTLAILGMLAALVLVVRRRA